MNPENVLFLKKYIVKLRGNSFRGWSDDSKAGYLTALISVEKMIEKLTGNIKNV